MSMGWGETVKKFYTNGKIYSATFYKKGKKNGIEHIYYPDGATLKYAKSYANNKLHGVQQAYHKSALVSFEENYLHGTLDGKSRYYVGGLLSKEIIYQMGVIKNYKEFYQTGVVKLEIVWKKGEPIEGHFYNEIAQGKPLSAQKLQELNLKAFIASLPHIKE